MTLEEANKYFSGDRYAVATSGAVILEVAENYSKCSMKLDERHMNARGFMMGGVPFTLADFAFAIATNDESHGTVTVTSQISYLNAPKGDEIFAECVKVKEGRRNCFYTVTITDNLGIAVAVVNVCGLHV